KEHPGVDHASLHGGDQVLFGVESLGQEGGRCLQLGDDRIGQPPGSVLEYPDLRADTAAELDPDEQDDGDREYEDEEDAAPVTEHPPQVRVGDRERLHSANLRFRTHPAATPCTTAMPIRTAAAGKALVHGAPPARSPRPRRNQ